ncbi:hypothetical protein ANDA3_2466 [plant metagenome]|uniref:Uncharacterized protein n=3 Tax=root TaxID=1 RepID=A0A1C3JY72_9BURK|nr:hypothetical protein ODI_00411 [Orrella dioscoreae]SOE49971.1 hypothetical protein ODI_R2426 [Orrella dioscoreae]
MSPVGFRDRAGHVAPGDSSPRSSRADPVIICSVNGKRGMATSPGILGNVDKAGQAIFHLARCIFIM